MIFDHITIEPASNGGFDVYGHDVYPEFSVLADQPRRCHLDHFPTLGEAQEAYDGAEVLDHSTYVSRLDELAPHNNWPSYAPEWAE